MSTFDREQLYPRLPDNPSVNELFCFLQNSQQVYLCYLCYTFPMKVGTDIIQIKRIEKLVKKYGIKFKQRYLSKKEIAMARKLETLAGLWAAKEAISKALGCGIGAQLAFHDIIIAKDHKGAPFFKLTKEAQKVFRIKSSSISISHDGGFAIAIAVIDFKK